MTDIFTPEERSRIMSLIKSKDTAPEKEVFRYLRREGIRFRRHHESIVGKPDISIPAERKAVFVDGDFWHGWRFPRWRNKLPSDFWKEKISANIRRDKRNFAKLRRQGWKVLRVWDHQLSTREKRNKTLRRIQDFLT